MESQYIYSNLDDDCFLEVLNWLSPNELFKMLRVNKQLNRLAAVKLKVKTKAIALAFTNISTCHHLGAISWDQILVLKTLFQLEFYKSSRNALFLNVLAKCSGVKSINLESSQLPGDLLIEAFQRCPELDCIDLGWWHVRIDEFESILNQIGQKTVYIIRDLLYNHNQESEVRLLSSMASKFANIKRIDLYMTGFLTSHLLSAIRMPETCWVSVDCREFTGFVYEDNLNQLFVSEFDWSTLGNRLNRLTSFRFNVFQLKNGLVVGGVDFTNLKKLDVGYLYHSVESVNCLSACRYPKLEEFYFYSKGLLNENDFDRLFRRMTSVKKLTICSYGDDLQEKQTLPQSAINHLKNLETIVLVIHVPLFNWQPKGFLNQFDRYVDDISSLKKLVVETYIWPNDKLDERIVDEVRRMKIKQNRVEVVLVCKI